MSHALDMSSGKAAIAYAGEMPWHGLGQQIHDGMTLHQMRVAARLNWDVLELEPFYNFTPKATKGNPNPEPQQRSVPNRKALVRSDNGNWLSQMSENKYNVRQPKEIVEFFRDICDAGGFKITTLGALNEGRKVWCQAERVGGAAGLSDLIKPTILLADSYDGTMATIAQFSTTTVVCANTLAMARGEGGAVKVPHSKQFDADKVKRELGAIDGAFQKFMDNMFDFTKVKMTKDFKERFFLKLFGVPTADAKKEKKHFFGSTEGKGNTWKRAKIDKDLLSTQSANVVHRLMELSEDGGAPGSDFFTGTLYNALQTVTYYQDHEARSWGNKRWESAMLGSGADTKSNALDLALELIK